tara:strand:- start:947 stop:1276 length:330 start_codon:yes stop_codon:yes gene_type:complete
MTNLLLTDVTSGAYPEVTPATDSAWSAVIPASPAEQSITVPAGAQFAKFTSDANFYATFDGSTVAVPGNSAASAASVSVLNPSVKHIRSVPTIKLNATGLAHVTVEFFK